MSDYKYLTFAMSSSRLELLDELVAAKNEWDDAHPDESGLAPWTREWAIWYLIDKYARSEAERARSDRPLQPERSFLYQLLSCVLDKAHVLGTESAFELGKQAAYTRVALMLQDYLYKQ